MADGQRELGAANGKDEQALVPFDPAVAGAVMLHMKGGGIEGLRGITRGQLGGRAIEMRACYSEKEEHPAKPGMIVFGPDAVDTLEAVFILAHHIRVLKEGSEENKETTCFSTDGLIPSRDVARPKSDACGRFEGDYYVGNCGYAEWTGRKPNRKAPPCVASFALLGLALSSTGVESMKYDPPRPFWLAPSAISGAIALRAFLNAYPGNALHLLRWKVKYKSVTGKGRRSYYVPTFEKLGMVPDEIFRPFVTEAAKVVYTPWMKRDEEDEDDTPPARDVTPAADDDSVPF